MRKQIIILASGNRSRMGPLLPKIMLVISVTTIILQVLINKASKVTSNITLIYSCHVVAKYLYILKTSVEWLYKRSNLEQLMLHGGFLLVH